MAKAIASSKTSKRDSNEVDKLVAEVDKLHDGGSRKGMSINKACAKVGLQNTVYYFRKRRDAAEALAAQGNVPVSNTNTGTKDLGLHNHKDTASLMREYKELEARMNQIKMAIADKVMNSQLEK